MSDVPFFAEYKKQTSEPRKRAAATQTVVVEPTDSGAVGGAKAGALHLRSRVFGHDSTLNHIQLALEAQGLDAQGFDGAANKSGVFVFMGAPGVGKAHTAKMLAESLGRPFKVFDMATFEETK
jgi:ATP-dependent Clp protease ATP-binding subunit ClpA